MNKFLRYSFVALLAMIGLSANAGKIVFAEITPALENGVQYTDPFDGGDFTVVFGGGGNNGKYYTTGSGIRLYGDGTMTIEAKSGRITTMIKVVFGLQVCLDMIDFIMQRKNTLHLCLLGENH